MTLLVCLQYRDSVSFHNWSPRGLMFESMSHGLNGLASRPWSAWVACAALIVGVGAFLDEWYATKNAKLRARRRLIVFLKQINRIHLRARRHYARRETIALIIWLLVLVAVYGWLTIEIYRENDRMDGRTAVHMLLHDSPIVLIATACVAGVVSLSGRFLYASFWITRAILWIALRPVCSIDKSPYKFAAGMAGLWILVAKLLIEVLRSHTNQ